VVYHASAFVDQVTMHAEVSFVGLVVDGLIMKQLGRRFLIRHGMSEPVVVVGAEFVGQFVVTVVLTSVRILGLVAAVGVELGVEVGPGVGAEVEAVTAAAAVFDNVLSWAASVVAMMQLVRGSKLVSVAVVVVAAAVVPNWQRRQHQVQLLPAVG